MLNLNTQPYALDERTRHALAGLEGLGFNYDLAQDGPITPERGWKIESFRVDLPAEPPGLPLPAGSFEAARRVLRSLRFVDPAVIRVYYDPDSDLPGRVLLLRVRVARILTVDFGARVVSLVDEVSDGEARWGFAYRTLATHFEMGEITFMAHKDIASGEVWVTVERYSKLGRIPNPFLRIGARLLAPSMQARYARYVLRRIPELVRREIGDVR